eukprot:35415-Eustigmatos_ZCMA.PRE.1
MRSVSTSYEEVDKCASGELVLHELMALLSPCPVPDVPFATWRASLVCPKRGISQDRPSRLHLLARSHPRPRLLQP